MKRLIISLLLFATVSFATTINVPADQSTIQAGIDAASSGDTVLVAQGTYVENINYNGKNIALIGEDRETTIIDGNENGSVVTFENGEGSTAILSGFTLRNGYQNPKGGGIYITGATPQLEYLIITENIADPVSNSGSGGGVMVEFSASTTFDHVIITSNSGVSGGGIFVDHNSNVILTNCTITQNTAENGGGITMYNSSATLNNTILWGNNTTITQQMFINNSSLTITYSDIEGGWEGEGNIDADPLFVDAVDGDYHLTSSSPCIDAGDPASDLDPDGTVADMGAYYYDQSSTTLPNISVDPESLYQYLLPGESATQQLTISNIDTNDLTFYFDTTITNPVHLQPDLGNYHTGTTDGSSLTEASLIKAHGGDDSKEAGWAIFNISGMHSNIEVDSIIFNYYVNDTYYPYWSITAVNVDPLTASASDLHAEILAGTDAGTAYLYSNESSSFTDSVWYSDILINGANDDLEDAIGQGYFVIGITDRDGVGNYYLDLDGWNEANPPSLDIYWSAPGNQRGVFTAPAIANIPYTHEEIHRYKETVTLGLPVPKNLIGISDYENHSQPSLNAFLYTESNRNNHLDWLDINPLDGVIPGNSTLDVNITFYAPEDFPGGTLFASLVLRSNDEIDSVLLIPTYLEIPDIFPPNPPDSLTAAPEYGYISLAWDASLDPGLHKYNIYRGTSISTITLIDSVIGDPPALNYQDSVVTQEQLYYYQVSAVDQAGNESTLSDTVSVLFVLPTISVDPDSLYQYLLPGESAVQTFTIANEGNGALYYSIHQGGDLTGTWTLFYDWGCSGVPGDVPVEFTEDGGLLVDEVLLGSWVAENNTVDLTDGDGCAAVTFEFNAYFYFDYYSTIYYIYVEEDAFTGLITSGYGAHDGDNSGQRLDDQAIIAAGSQDDFANILANDVATIQNPNQRSTVTRDSRDIMIVIDPDSGMVAPGESTDISISMSVSSDDPGGIYNSIIGIYSNDPINSSVSVYLTLEVPDLFPPNPPDSLTAAPDIGYISLAWNASLDPGLHKYNIYKGSSISTITLIDSVVGSPPDTIYQDQNTTVNELYYYQVSAVDQAGNESALSDTVSAIMSVNLVINEIMQNPAAVNDSEGEWFEIYNYGNVAVQMQNWIIKDTGNDSHTISQSITIPSGSYFVFGNNSNTSSNGGVNIDYNYGTDMSLNNGSDEIILESPENIIVDSVAWDNGATFPDLEGASMALQSPELDNNVGSNWTTSNMVYGDGDYGTPGMPNYFGIIELDNSYVDFDTVNVNETATSTVVISNTGNGDLVVDSITVYSGNIDGYAISFDGVDDYVDVSSLVNDIATGDFTISLWMRIDGISDNGILFRLGDAPSTNDIILAVGGGGNLVFSVVNSGWESAVSEQSSWVSGEWYHIAATMSSVEGMKIYINGVQDGSNATTTRGSIYSELAYLGRDIFNGPYFKGLITEFDIWNTALSQSQIQSQMHVSVAGNIVDWNFNSTDGTTLYDLSINANHGTIYGANWYYDSPLLISSSSDESNDFSITLDNYTITPAATGNLTIYFAPTVYGYQSAVAYIYTNDPDQSVVPVGMLGFGYYPAPDIELESGSIDFGDVMHGLTEQESFNIYNTGETALDIDTIYCTANFSVEQGIATVEAGDTLALVVTFSPDAETTFPGTLTIVTANDPDEDTLTVSLAGTGTAQAPIMEVSADLLDFGVFEQEQSITRQLTIYNAGLLDLAIEEINISGNSGFSTTFSDATIVPNDSVVVDFQFYTEDNITEAFATATIVAANADNMDISLQAGYFGSLHVTTDGSDETGNGTSDNPFATIQTAIDSSSDGDTVLVAAGTYVENINYNGKNISVIGADRETTIIDGDSIGTVVTFENGEDSSAVLSEFTITNGYSGEGGGIYISYSSPLITNCIITQNHVSSTGGGIFATAFTSGYPAPTIKNCLIYNNTADAEGGGVKFHYSSGKIINCTIVNNYAPNAGGGLVVSVKPIEIINSIIYNNDGNQIHEIQPEIGSDISYSNIEGGWEGEGNIDADPLFCNTDSGDYTLAENSPCVGTGENGINMGAFGIGCGLYNFSPTEFSIMEPNNNSQITIDESNINDGNIIFSWEASSDENGDSLVYLFRATSVEIGNHDLDTNTTSFNVSYLDILNDLVENNVTDANVVWTIFVTDGIDTVEALNAPFTFFIDGSDALSIYSEGLIPEVFALHQNYPNPFNPITTLRYDLPEQATVNIIIYDMLGRQVKSLINQTQDAGFKSVIWNATNNYGKPVSAGVYLYQIQAGEFVQTRKMVLLK